MIDSSINDTVGFSNSILSSCSLSSIFLHWQEPCLACQLAQWQALGGLDGRELFLARLPVWSLET